MRSRRARFCSAEARRLMLSYSYGCTMAYVSDPELAKGIQTFAHGIPKEVVIEGEGDCALTETPHLTIKYGIITTSVEEVMGVLEEVEPFPVTLGRISVFDNPDANVLKIDVKKTVGLVAVNQTICDNLRTVDLHEWYKPHVTIAYLKKNEKNPYYYEKFCGDQFAGRTFMVSEIVFSMPDGSKETIPLCGQRSKMVAKIAGRK